ncbi:MAG: AMP-binding protein, partial [Desulfobacterales bacterium]|nr:AMP-binding protein [Desulfobacterales bacterium]
LGEFDDEGNFRIVGRAKDMILRGGTNIFPREVEELLIRHPAVAAVSVVGVPDKRLGEKACAVVVVAGGMSPPTLADLTEFLLGQGIAKFKLPEHLVLTDHLATNAGGKVDKGQIVQFAVEQLTAEKLLN